MSLTAHLTRLPRPYDPDLGAETADLVPEASGDLRALLTGAAGSSPYLKSLIERERDWLGRATAAPEAAVEAVLSGLADLPPNRLRDGLRQAKRRVALITALADLGGVWPLEQVTGLLTRLADQACTLALQAEIATLIRRGKLPGQTEDDVACAGGMVVLAMGKMGAGELNYSSDIDLICLFDETRFDPDTFHEARQGFVKATRAMCATLSDRTREGYVFRTDLRLRPDPAVTPVCIAMEAAERYYESLGRTWERAAYIKARPAAGDTEAGTRFLDTLRPFVWRRHLDFASIQDAHDIRLRIRESKRMSGALSIPGHDLKLGRGGIREIEFFTQTRQLIAGGRDRALRLRGTVEGLAALVQGGWVPEDVAEKLSRHYRTLREAEHRIQMVQDAQTHKMPQSQDGIARVAALMGVDSARMLHDLHSCMTEVHALTEDFFAPDVTPVPRQDPVPDTLDASILARWPSYPALRSERAAHIFERLKPEILGRLSRTARPDEALLAQDGFLAGLPAGVQLFSLFEANPQLIDLLVDIVGTSPELAAYLSRNSGVFDAVIGGDFFADWPGEPALTAELTTMLASESDYEAQLDTARRWRKEWHFRVGVHLLRNLVTAEVASAQYADIAGAVLSAIAPVVRDQFARKYGPPPGRGAAVLGMGSLGAGRLNPASDLDIIVIYDPDGHEMSDGPKQLATRPYYARLTQALITAMTAPMSQGRLYEVDMRLRPSGNQGPVATSWASFQAYQRDEAWVWEHLALTRARVMTGPAALATDIEAVRQEVLSQPRNRADLLKDVVEMRARIAAAKTPAGRWDAKTGPGRLQDIELLAQAGTLLAAGSGRSVTAGLAACVATGLLNDADAKALASYYRLLWSVMMAMRLVAEQGSDGQTLSEGAAAFVCRCTGYTALPALEQDIDAAVAAAATIVETALAEGARHEG